MNKVILAPVLRELVENGAEHNDSNDPRVEVEVKVGDTRETARARPITIRIADNGPGIPDQELLPLRTGSESALEHGSGIGLWFVKWSTTTMNGKVEFERTDSQGTLVILQIPEAN